MQWTLVHPSSPHILRENCLSAPPSPLKQINFLGLSSIEAIKDYCKLRFHITGVLNIFSRFVTSSLSSPTTLKYTDLYLQPQSALVRVSVSRPALPVTPAAAATKHSSIPIAPLSSFFHNFGIYSLTCSLPGRQMRRQICSCHLLHVLGSFSLLLASFWVPTTSWQALSALYLETAHSL